MSKRLMSVIQNRDGKSLAAMYSGHPANVQNIVNPEAEKLVDALFRQLRQVFPAAGNTNLRTEADESAAKKQWIAAFAENGIRSREQLSAGMQYARANSSPFWPSPGQFIEWCRQGEVSKYGLPGSDELYLMVMKYSAERGYYESPERYPWPSNACWLMVTKLYSQMRSFNLTESELRKRCERELKDMARRAARGETFPAPVAQIPKLHIPVSGEKGLDKIAEIRRKLKIGKAGAQHDS
ncbi:DNA replication protein [Lonsdalea britannica]|uniref:DNA replication protein n=1 Tax=Lonsdalea britannica TaxID=1082704 RepID=A0AAD0SH53_9GAMM|nr:replication protein P [Lonsdalea britannica]AXW87795.1 DNA replication protein [Lonsdalea britannica]OSM95920.1 DNA replication protein [Lonsdalea britannica]